MKKLFVLSAIAVLAACGGSDNKPANDPSTTNTTAEPATTPTSDTPAPASTDQAAPASTGEQPADAPKE